MYSLDNVLYLYLMDCMTSDQYLQGIRPEKHHTKTGHKTLVVVRPKEGIDGTSLTRPSFGITPTIELYSVAFTGYIS